MTLIRSIRKSITRSQTQNIGVYKDILPRSLFDEGYTRLSDNPEIVAGVNVIADLVSNMTIRLMENDKNGNKRIYNELSRKLDIEPNEWMTRKNLMYGITQSLLLYGNQVTFPEKEPGANGKLLNLHPLNKENIEYFKYTDKFGYYIKINGKRYEPEELLHFSLNPTSESPYVGTGYRTSLKDLLDTLKKANNMKQTYMGGKYTPPLIISVASSSKELASKEGRDKLLTEYVENTDAGKPMILPSDMMKVETIKPLTLKDVAVNETIQLDKRAVAAILGIPSFLLGVGEWNQAEFNNFIETKISSIAETIQQEMTKKLIKKPEWHIKFNTRSLKSFAQQDLATMGARLHAQGLMTGNELRSWIDLDPMEDLNKLTLLENFVPLDKLGDQEKLNKVNKDEKGGD